MSFNVINKITNINISKDDENFLKEFIKDFYNKIIETNDFSNFDYISNDWIKFNLENNNKDPEKILKMMENHKESKFWFTSLIGSFYQFGIGCNINRGKALDFYLISIDNKIENDFLNLDFNQLHLIENNEDTFELLQYKNIMIGKYLLAFFYYKDNILFDIKHKQNKLIYLIKVTEDSELEEQFNSIISCQNRNNNIKADYRRAYYLLLSLAEKNNLNIKSIYKKTVKLSLGLAGKENLDISILYNLAICYMEGIGTQKDKQKAYYLFLNSEQIELHTKNRKEKKFIKNLRAVIFKNPMSHFNVGFNYLCGEGVNKDETKAIKWFLNSAILGCSDGQFYLGCCYYKGIGTDKNEIKALEWWLKSAENENAMGQSIVGNCYQHGYVVYKNEIEAFEWYMKAAKNGDAIAQNSLGKCYQYGKGTDKNEIKAFKWYLKSAIAGYIDGQYNLGYCYNYGMGTDVNETKAFEWYTKSAESGHATAQMNLGICYMYGKGIDKNETKAFEYLLKSAENGNAKAQNYVGKCYHGGIGVDINVDKANYWYEKALNNGIEDLTNILSEI
jgi:TPR repeat protein